MVIFELCQKFNVKYLESLIVFNILYILKFTINIKGNDFVGFFAIIFKSQCLQYTKIVSSIVYN